MKPNSSILQRLRLPVALPQLLRVNLASGKHTKDKWLSCKTCHKRVSTGHQHVAHALLVPQKVHDTTAQNYVIGTICHIHVSIVNSPLPTSYKWRAIVCNLLNV